MCACTELSHIAEGSHDCVWAPVNVRPQRAFNLGHVHSQLDLQVGPHDNMLSLCFACCVAGV